MINGLVWGFIFVVLGILNLLIYQTAIYPFISRRYETAKVIGVKKISPHLLAGINWFVSLFLLPVLGFMLGYKGVMPNLAATLTTGAAQ